MRLSMLFWLAVILSCGLYITSDKLKEITIAPEPKKILSNVATIKDVPSLRQYNSKTDTIFENGKISNRAEIHAKWIHFLADDDTFKDIDTEFVKTSNGFEVFNAPFHVIAPDRSTGIASFINDNNYDPIKKEKITEPPLTETIQALGVADVAGEIVVGDLGWGMGTYVLYSGAYPALNADLIYYVHYGRAPRLKKLVRFNSNPNIATNAEISFAIGYDQPIKFKRANGVNWGEAAELRVATKLSIVPLSKQDSIRGIGIKKPLLWDSNSDILSRKVQGIDIKLNKIANGYTLTKVIPGSFFTDIVYPAYTDTTQTFFPDPSVEVSSADGFVFNNPAATNWATLRNGAGSGADDTGATNPLIYLQAVGATANDWNYLGKSIFIFDTSGIGATSTITSSTILLASNGTKSDNLVTTPDIDIYNATSSSRTAVVSGDFVKIGSTSQTGSPISYAGWDGTDTVYNAFVLNATGRAYIQLATSTVFGVRNPNRDVANSEPTPSANASRIDGYYADQAGTTVDPKLTVDYTAIGAGGIIRERPTYNIE